MFNEQLHEVGDYYADAWAQPRGHSRLLTVTWIHSTPAGQYDVGVQIFSDVYVTFHDTVVRQLVNTNTFHSWTK